MEKRFQIFISSTYDDLIAEREAVALAVLRSRNMPSGMELSSGANERTLDIIYKWIDDSDIFILLLGGRYGSVDSGTGLSYTELEYRYAKAHHKPIVALALTEKYIDSKITRGEIAVRAAYERIHLDKFARFKRRVTGDSFCILISDIRELEPKILAALDSVKMSYSPTGWVRTAAVVEDLIDLYARYTNCYLDIVGNNTYSRREIEDLLRTLNEVIRNLICAEVGWIDVMTPTNATPTDAPNLLVKNVRCESGWLRVLFSSIRRTNPPVLIPIEVNGRPWRGSGSALACCGMDYVSSFRKRYSPAAYDLPQDVASNIEARYAYWRQEHYFASLLAVAVSAPGSDPPEPVGVLNLNFTVEEPLGADDALSPQRSVAIVNVLEPALRVLATAIEKYR